MLAAPSPQVVTTQNISRCCQISSGRQSCPTLRTTDADLLTFPTLLVSCKIMTATLKKSQTVLNTELAYDPAILLVSVDPLK